MKFIKGLYIPKKFVGHKNNLTFEEVRHLTIKPLNASKVRSPKLWMPPQSAVRKVASLLDCHLAYLVTAGMASAPTPNFMQYGCLQKCSDGTIQYDLGEDVHTDCPEDQLTADPECIAKKLNFTLARPRKRTLPSTPQKGRRRKSRPQATSTPKKAHPEWITTSVELTAIELDPRSILHTLPESIGQLLHNSRHLHLPKGSLSLLPKGSLSLLPKRQPITPAKRQPTTPAKRQPITPAKKAAYHSCQKAAYHSCQKAVY